ncbi:ABC transporter permease subunit [Microbacterium sp. Au-Mic1]|uniref:ABC transporter permease n=1 Tax=Microbacterium sp. Au-Mic1 TaxID=2906457 RepID=UPI001E29E5E1|nr:ABC transporter permease subunit [Microbacterium sp. Au-Mic1]MCE4025505.1 ABC transporter permease subunit [Microbacterium sp. Au-Mic1]
MSVTVRASRMLAGALVLCGLWQVVGQTGALGPSFPALSQVGVTLLAPGYSALFLGAIGSTTLSACLGLVIGGGMAVVVAGVRQTLTSTRPGLDRLAALIHAIPFIAIAPVMIIVFGRETAPTAVAALASFFPVYAGSTVAFAAAPQSHEDLFTILGGSRMARFTRLHVLTALPGLAGALKLAAPSAVLGAVIGEWFGAPQGIGLLILSSAQNYNVPLLWAAAVLSTLMAMVGFVLFAAVQSLAIRRFT